MLRAGMLALWILAVVAFVWSWVTGDRRLVGVGAALLVVYIIQVARRRTSPSDRAGR